MSAFVVSDFHINAIVNEAERNNWLYPSDYYTSKKAAQILHAENARSVNHRYNEHEKHPFTWKPNTRQLSKMEIFSSLDCLEYQFCETDDYHQTEAYKLVTMIRKAAIRSLPGYDDAGWGLVA